MHKAFIVAVFCLGLAGCGVVNSLVDGMKYVKAVEEDLEQATGQKPAVGFNYNNGRLTQVSVTFPQLYDAKPLRELAETTRAAVVKEFKQAPDHIVLAFAIGKG